MSIFFSCSLLSGFTPTCLPFAPSPPDRLLSLYHIRSLIRTHRGVHLPNLTVFHIFISFHIFIYSFIIITIIIIMDFHSAYILRNKTESLSIIVNRDAQKVIIVRRDHRRFIVEIQDGIGMSRVFFGRYI